MLNKEKFAKEIMEIACNGYSVGIRNGKPVACQAILCSVCDACCINSDDRAGECRDVVKEWANSEYVEPPVDWSEVLVDTPILVKNFESQTWFKRHFAECEHGTVCTWIDGKTSWTANGEIITWKYAKLAESEER